MIDIDHSTTELHKVTAPSYSVHMPIMRQFLKFSLVGISNTAIDIGLFALLVWLYPTNSSLRLIIYNSIAVLAAALNSFIWNKAWTFRKAHRIDAVEIWRFALLALLTITINNASLLLLAHVLPAWVMTNTLYVNAVKVGAIAMTLMISFVGMRVWVFVDRHSEESSHGAIVMPLHPYPYSLTVVLPAYNEEENIGTTLHSVISALPMLVEEYEVIVVNDGSSDKTAARVEEVANIDAHVRLITHEVNQGAGAALITGFRAAHNHYTMYMDSDGQFDIGSLARMLPHLHEVDAVFGYRIHRQDRFMRKVNAWGWRNLVHLVFGVRIRDLDCGFKVFRTEFLQTQEFDARGAMLLAEMVYRFMRTGGSYQEVGVQHFNRKFGAATGAKLSVILKAFKELWYCANKWAQE